jgi:hypothetical protein
MTPALRRLAPTPVLDSYWRFAAERQRVFMTRVRGATEPWSNDPVLRKYKFTNAYRASDRVSQYLIRRVIYRDDLPNSPEEVLFRILIFKLFNKIQTWEHLEAQFGAVLLSDYSFERYDAALNSALKTGARIYSAAYIMPPATGAFKHNRKHQNHLRLVEYMLKSGISAKLAKARSMGEAYAALISYPTIGEFLGYQFITDINYSELIDFSEMDFVVPGPGARDGICKSFTNCEPRQHPGIIQLVTELQEAELERVGVEFRSLWGRPLQLIDCQNLFCEIGKYARIAHPEISGLTGRTRIKQLFRPTGRLPTPWYPPKWGLNDRIAER